MRLDHGQYLCYTVPVKRVIIPERWEKIIEMVELKGSASVEEIAQALSISLPTVRRDLARIHQRGLIKRTRGGATPSSQGRIGLTITESRRINPTEKEIIGRVAADLIEPGESVMIDGGFTTYQVARHIHAADVKIVTNSLDVAQAVVGRKDVSLILLGGEMLVESGTTVGASTEVQIRGLTVDKAIIGVNAISPEDGLAADNQLTAQTKKAMIERSRELIVVADHSKLGRSALYRVAPIDAVTTLVTDDAADPSILDEFRAAGVEVIVASEA
ncbi:MAG: DeoR/GlpR family DNA-binding transcription regulator [Armatimonadota bacterium]